MSDFQFSFDPTVFPTPPVPSSADLFSPTETNDLIGFLDNFGYTPPAYPDGSVGRRSMRKPIATPVLPNTTQIQKARPLLSTPQKRLNHIMSEQKRRNAIRDGYAQLISLLAPAGSGPVIDMPSRGRPKGSGSRSNGQTKGKSGVLFRAVEYCKWLEEGRDALLEEVLRTERAAGIIR